MTAVKKIAVLGGGNGGHAMAADLTMKGYEVCLCEFPEFKANIAPVLEKKAIDFIDVWGEKHTVRIAFATTDIREAISGASYIMVNAPAVGAVKFFAAMMPYLDDGQTVLKWSGNFSALLFAGMMKKAGMKKNVTLAEGHTMPWGCRLVAPGTVQIMVWVARVMLAAFPAQNTAKVLRDIADMYPVVAGENVLATSLNNLNPTVHPVGTVMNAGWIDTIGKDFYFYRDGNTLSISRGIKATFEDVSRLAQAIGVTMVDYPEEDFWKKSGIMSTYSRAAFDKEGATARISGPDSVKSRYITEDLPQGLVPMAKLARQFGVDTPMIDAIIQFASVINQADYMAEGYSLEDLGLAGLSKEEITRYLNEGI